MDRGGFRRRGMRKTSSLQQRSTSLPQQRRCSCSSPQQQWRRRRHHPHRLMQKVGGYKCASVRMAPRPYAALHHQAHGLLL